MNKFIYIYIYIYIACDVKKIGHYFPATNRISKVTTSMSTYARHKITLLHNLSSNLKFQMIGIARTASQLVKSNFFSFSQFHENN